MRLREQPRSAMTAPGAQERYELAALQIADELHEQLGYPEKEALRLVTEQDYRLLVRRVYLGWINTAVAADAIHEDLEFTL